MKIEKVNFTFDTGVVSEKQYDEHLKLYSGYVSKVNEITDKLKDGKGLRSDANKTYSEYRGLKKGETFALDGVILHEEYFRNIKKEESSPGPVFLKLAEDFFGGFERWAEDFVACAKATRGWCVAAYEQRTKTFRNLLLDAHDDGNVCMAFPVVIIDMYEHAYFLDYGTDSAAYIKKFMEGINWNVIERRAAAVAEKAESIRKKAALQ